MRAAAHIAERRELVDDTIVRTMGPAYEYGFPIWTPEEPSASNVHATDGPGRVSNH